MFASLEFPSSGRVLVVDDDEIFLQYLVLIFKKYEIEAHGTLDTINCIDFIRQYQPDVILLDMHMPKRDGLSICAEIRSQADIQHIPVIFISARNDEATRISAFRGLGDDFIAKPIIETELITRIGVRLERSQAMRERELAVESLQQQQQNILAILNQLDVGAIVLDNHRNIRFISRHCEDLLTLSHDKHIGENWRSLPFSNSDLHKIEQQIQSDEPREKLLLSIRRTNKYFNLDIKSDPGKKDNLILFFYDVSEIYRLREQLHNQNNNKDIILGASLPIIEMKERIERVAQGNWTVLIEGETGTGKDLAARQCHLWSDRKNGPFVAINCAGLSESLVSSQLFGHRKGAFTGAIDEQIGLLEAANGGSLFLDEIGDIPLSVQVKLLRALEQREIIRIGETQARKIDVRIIAATHKNLKREVANGNFREDFYFRIQVARIEVPALRKRREDILLLARHFLDSFSHSTDYQFTSEVEKALWSYRWPGNVRELKNAIEFAMVNSRENQLQLADLPPEILQPDRPAVTSFEGMDEANRIKYALETCAGNRTQAAKLLGIGRATLYRHMSRLGLA